MELAQEKNSISIYVDEIASGRDVILAVLAIKKAFPSLPANFYDMLDIRIRENNFTVERLNDAVAYVIDNCLYPIPTIANFISFDRIVKFKTHDQMCEEAADYPQVWKQWLPIKFPNFPKTVWVFANDVVRYKLDKYQVK